MYKYLIYTVLIILLDGVFTFFLSVHQSWLLCLTGKCLSSIIALSMQFPFAFAFAFAFPVAVATIFSLRASPLQALFNFP